MGGVQYDGNDIWRRSGDLVLTTQPGETQAKEIQTVRQALDREKLQQIRIILNLRAAREATTELRPAKPATEYRFGWTLP